VRARIASNTDNRPAIEVIAAAINETWKAGAGAKVTIVASGPLTNIALFVSVYPHLLDAVERIVFMGGGIGIGNRSAVAGAVKFKIQSVPLEPQLLLPFSPPPQIIFVLSDIDM
jgi:uridine nucleosidase